MQPRPRADDFQALPAELAGFHQDLQWRRATRFGLTRPPRPPRIRGSLFAEGYPSGQREQTVNLPAYAFEGSNPSPSTSTRESRRGVGLCDADWAAWNRRALRV